MKLLPVRHLWGVTEPWEVCIPRYKALGYVAIEAPLPPDAAGRDRLLGLLTANGLKFNAMTFTAGSTPAEHLESQQKQLEEAKKYPLLKVVTHSGSDTWGTDTSIEFYRAILKLEAAAGVTAAHETHRGRPLYNPWTTRDILTACPTMRLCCDFSHWCCVTESLLGHSTAEIELAASRCIHVHARVGYEEGPQVPDPSAPEYAGHLAAHEVWWEKIWAAHKARGETAMTMTPEFGPPGYLHTLPHTNVPVADLEKVCQWIMDRQVARFAGK